RPQFNPLIVHVPDLAAAERLAIVPESARRLAAVFWPGPLTLVLRRRPNSGLSELVSAGLDTVAIRVPDHPIARAVLAAAGVPVAAPSANRSGHVSATAAQHVAADFDGMAPAAAAPPVALILDGGPTAHGLESTVLDASGDTIVMLRPGAVPADAIEAVLGARIGRALDGGRQPMSPGQLVSHYAPRARVRLAATEVQDGEALLAFGQDVPATNGPMINLSPRGDLTEAAANLFAALRKLDATGAAGIAVMPIPDHGLGEAINDRLNRAAGPR
ncbi:MAG: L-threonylcarbamoyladenylate synthase, partial [Xanthomonadales bacterium]|nr:L-threonylcarbamoyladenylate synthase [Xanthomonadales bacterium]